MALFGRNHTLNETPGGIIAVGNEKRMIAPVSDNFDKQKTYQELIGKYNRAIKGGFYYEAILISYAMIEDRLRSMIYHMGFISNRSEIKIWKRNREILIEMIEQYKKEEENTSVGILSMEGKIKIIRCVVRWATNTAEQYNNDRFRQVLKSQIESIDVDSLLDALDSVKNWKAYRNEIVHSLLNKNTYSIHEELAFRAEEGIQLARIIDSQIKILKKGNKIRKSVNLKND